MAKRFLCYNTEDVDAGKVNVDVNGCLEPNTKGFVLVTTEDGNRLLTWDATRDITFKEFEDAFYNGVLRFESAGTNGDNVIRYSNEFGTIIGYRPCGGYLQINTIMMSSSAQQVKTTVKVE